MNKKKSTNKKKVNTSSKKTAIKHSQKSKSSRKSLQKLNPAQVSQQILTLLSDQPEKGLTHSSLLNAMKANVKKEKRIVNEQLNELLRKKLLIFENGHLQFPGNKKAQHKPSIEINYPSKVKTVHAPKHYEGILDINRRGTGFVMVEGLDQDIRVSERDLNMAFKGDKVRVALKSGGRFSAKKQGKIIEILSRRRVRFVGKVLKVGVNQWMIEADERSSHTDFFIQEADLKGAKHNDKVLFEMLSWSNKKGLPQARVLENFGVAGSKDATILSILGEAQYRASFPEEVETYTKELDLEIRANEVVKRLDIRDKNVFTIDPEDAKDFDDALSIELLENGNYYLGVHIADVSHFVEKGSILDKEALDRATSVYLVDRVIPMLPEALSNYACSLRPNEDKYAYSCFMEIGPRGKLVSHKIVETVIHSRRRFTYEEAQQVLDGALEDSCKDDLLIVASLANTLMKKRMREGSIKFETPEPRFVLDETGRPIEVKVKERKFAHKLIEECMLMANKTVALYVDQIRKERMPKSSKKDHFPFFYRVHDKPDAKKLAVLAEYIKPLGITFDPNAPMENAKFLNGILSQVEGKPIEQAVNDLMVRSMAKAEYKPENVGHFGLGFSHYAHFTSPIRRYPDVIVHRLLKAYHRKQKQPYYFTDLEELGTHTSTKEKEASIAERESIKLKQVEFVSERLGEVFDGVITGLTERGVYVLLKDIYCEGMVPVATMDDDFYVYHQHLQRLVGKSNGKVYLLGQDVQVKVDNTDLERRTIDLSFTKKGK